MQGGMTTLTSCPWKIATSVKMTFLLGYFQVLADGFSEGRYVGLWKGRIFCWWMMDVWMQRHYHGWWTWIMLWMFGSFKKRKGLTGHGRTKKTLNTLKFLKTVTLLKITTPASWDFNMYSTIDMDWCFCWRSRLFWRFRLWFVCFRVFEACGELWFPFEFHRQYPRAGVQELHWTMMIKLPHCCFMLPYYTNVAIVRVPYSDVRLKGCSRSVKSTDCMGEEANHAIRVLSCYRGSRWILQQTWILPGTCVAKTQLSTATCLSGLTLYNSKNSADASVILRRHVAVCHLCVLFPWQRLWNCNSICKWQDFFHLRHLSERAVFLSPFFLPGWKS